jgi:hypothetical protein
LNCWRFQGIAVHARCGRERARNCRAGEPSANATKGPGTLARTVAPAPRDRDVAGAAPGVGGWNHRVELVGRARWS